MPVPVPAPYLPTAKVTHILAGENMKPYEKALTDMCIHILYSEPLPALTGSLSLHLDLAVLPFSNKDFILDKSQHRLYKVLPSFGIQPQYANSGVEKGYPQEACLNCVRIGNSLFGNPKTIDKKIIELCKNNSVSFCAVKQGYTKCSVAVVSPNAVITDDSGIARAAGADKLDVLLVKKGSVHLQGFPYGFIGGCCSLVSKDIMLFTGNVQNHINADEICAFLRNYHIYPVSLTNGDLTDVGSFIPLLQQEEL